MRYLEHLKTTDPDVYSTVRAEITRQQEGMELIASENYVSLAVLEALGTVFTNKYSEGYPGKRYYGGQENTDVVENLARERAKKLFGAEHANVQPLSGAPANLAVYSALLKPGDTVLGMDLSHGGHLTHGHPVTLPAKIYNFVRYKTKPDGLIDYDEVQALAEEHHPALLLGGFSSYTRQVDYGRLAAIAGDVGAVSMFDMAHIAGLVAGGALPNPVPHFDVVTTTTHKTLRGPRGGMILCKEKYAKQIDKAVFPGLQGGPHMNQITALAVALGEAGESSFQEYARQVLKNAKMLETELRAHGFGVLFGGTENHMVMVDTVKSKGLSGKVAEEILDKVGMTVNKNVIPDDPRGPLDPSGIRIGVPAVTTRGMKEPEVARIAGWMNDALSAPEDKQLQKKIRKEVRKLCRQFAIYEELKI